MYWARPNSFCEMDFRKYATPASFAFTAVVGFQAIVWICAEFGSLSSLNDGPAPVNVPPDNLPKEAANAYDYWDGKRRLKEESKRVAEGRKPDEKKQEFER